MNLSFEIEEELKCLLDLMLDTDLDVSQQARLQEILREEEGATAFYVAYMKLSADLYRLSEEQIPPAAEELAFIPRRRREPRFDWASTVVACLLIGFFGMVLHGAWPNLKQHMPYLETFKTKPLAVHYATVIEAERTTWSLGGAVPGQPLSQHTCILDEGMIKLRLDSQVLAVIRAPATFRVDRFNHLHLDAGKVVAVVPREAIGFRVVTPDAHIIDLGTEFGVKVDEGRDTEVHVFKGKVEASLKVGSPQMVSLAKGEAARFTGGSHTAEKLAQADLTLFEDPAALATYPPAPPAIHPDTLFESFDGAPGMDLAGLHPDQAGTGIIWKSTRSAKADGSLRQEKNVAALLPFTPVDGHRYRLSVKINPSASPQPFDSAFTLGFTQGESLALHPKDSRTAWSSMTQPIASIRYMNNQHVLTHPTNTPGKFEPIKLEIQEPIELLEIQIVLDTRAPAWRLEWIVGNRLIDRFTYARNPSDIDYVSFGTQSFDGAIRELALQVD